MEMGMEMEMEMEMAMAAVDIEVPTMEAMEIMDPNRDTRANETMHLHLINPSPRCPRSQLRHQFRVLEILCRANHPPR